MTCTSHTFSRFWCFSSSISYWLLLVFHESWRESFRDANKDYKSANIRRFCGIYTSTVSILISGYLERNGWQCVTVTCRPLYASVLSQTTTNLTQAFYSYTGNPSQWFHPIPGVHTEISSALRLLYDFTWHLFHYNLFKCSCIKLSTCYLHVYSLNSSFLVHF